MPGPYRRSMYLIGAPLSIIILFGSSLSTVNTAWAQFSTPGKVSGTFVDPDVGYSITFPPGWSGFNFLGPMVLSTDLTDKTALNQTSIKQAMSQAAMMWIFPVNKTMVAAMSAMFSPGSAGSMPMMQNSPARNCSEYSSSYTKINGMSAFHMVATCQTPSAAAMYMTGYIKSEVVMVATKSHVIILTYGALSPEADAKYHDSFAQSLATFRVNDTVDVMSGMDDLSGAKPMVQPLKGVSKPLDVSLSSNSQVSSLSADEQARTISFSVDGGSQNAGMTRVEVDNVMQGPYTVTVDGNRTQAVTQATDDATGKTYLTIAYPTAHHDIVISGTQIVPEFPLTVLPVAGVMLAIVVLLARLGRK